MRAVGSDSGPLLGAVDGSRWHDRSIDSWQTLAALNNAEWCDTVCRSHGLRTVIDGRGVDVHDEGTALLSGRGPLVRHPSVQQLLARIDTSAGCSIKDSFETLDLSAYGFSVLFDAQWIVRPATEVTPTSTGLAWEVIREPEALTRWESVWRGDDGPEGLFRPKLLTNDAVAFRGETTRSGCRGCGPQPGFHRSRRDQQHVLRRFGRRRCVGRAASPLLAPCSRERPWSATNQARSSSRRERTASKPPARCGSG